MEKVKTPLNAPRLLGLLLACGALTLPACQSPPHPPTDAGATPSTVDSNDSAGEHTTEVDLSSATSNADGSAIVFDPLEAGKNLPDPCVELSSEIMNRIGFTSDYERFTYGLDDDLPGKGISCDLSLIEKIDEVTAQGFYSDNVSRDFIVEEGLFIRDARESKVPNAYFYTFSPQDQSSCVIGTHTPRGRLGLIVTGPTTWSWQDSCPLALKYFDKTYEFTNGFAWLKS
ncbi:hypothetical protein JIM95_003220 [Corynebacterium sp. CCM 8835]|uniref:DUF3558 domain-containing protein n=1 Tax=Corynebacterium antarcticum TaxID=2800405 RepID=A0ABS1FNN6_9CORY|nr:hypothetical protein [Corynebacterium antarcticum]MCK7641937.1 hypothetical protein [Corynebacterium antarcticum]MCL0245162.1 hypothetical protein [Corynebacterium antarcticum]MCX7539284.1 hypothetical protein [Corynebacterium antarcticum]